MKKGFTLAEILITLSILGIIVALTIPNLVHNYQKSVNIIRLKKYYAQITNNIDETLAEYNCDTIYCLMTKIDQDYYAENFKAKEPKTIVLKTIFPKITEDKSRDGKCVPTYTYALNGDRYNTDTVGGLTKYKYCISDKDNIGLGVWVGSFSSYTNDGCLSSDNRCGVLFLYLAGGNKKAVLGENVFVLNINGNGSINPAVYNDCDKNSLGLGCFDYLIKNNWKMDY